MPQKTEVPVPLFSSSSWNPWVVKDIKRVLDLNDALHSVVNQIRTSQVEHSKDFRSHFRSKIEFICKMM